MYGRVPWPFSVTVYSREMACCFLLPWVKEAKWLLNGASKREQAIRIFFFFRFTQHSYATILTFFWACWAAGALPPRAFGTSTRVIISSEVNKKRKEAHQQQRVQKSSCPRSRLHRTFASADACLIICSRKAMRTVNLGEGYPIPRCFSIQHYFFSPVVKRRVAIPPFQDSSQGAFKRESSLCKLCSFKSTMN